MIDSSGAWLPLIFQYLFVLTSTVMLMNMCEAEASRPLVSLVC